MYFIKLVGLSVLTYPHRRLACRVLVEDLRLNAPTLIGVLEDITVITRKITPTAYLQDILTYRRRHAVVSYCGIEHHRLDERWVFLPSHNPRHYADHHAFTLCRQRGQLI
jgi:hypothetical protein